MADIDVCLTFDFDAVSIWLHTFKHKNQPSSHSRGLFGVDIGAPRILDLLDDHAVKTTWFVPGHTVESFPPICNDVWCRGHDIQHHGWMHKNPLKFDSREEELHDIQRGIEAITELTGRRPIGYRSPAGEFSRHTVSILQELNFEYDSSLCGREFEPYYLRENWSASDDEPYKRGDQTSLVEVPRSWQRNDFTAFTYVPYPQLWGYAAENVMFDKWREQFDWMCENGGGVYVLVNHPQCIGKSNRISRLNELITYMHGTEGVKFKTVTEVAKKFNNL